MLQLKQQCAILLSTVLDLVSLLRQASGSFLLPHANHEVLEAIKVGHYQLARRNLGVDHLMKVLIVDSDILDQLSHLLCIQTLSTVLSDLAKWLMMRASKLSR